jgi:hypothetical protein
MKRKPIPLGLAAICSIIFLILVLAPGGCGFNLIPYEIHESISKGGQNESLFIKIFDILFSIVIFFIMVWVLNKISWKGPK